MNDPMLAHAAYELEVAGVEEDVRPSLLRAVAAFNSCEHSGGSASVCREILYKLLSYQNISPLTNNSFEWQEVGDGVWQSTRCSAMFSNDGGRTYYNVDELKYHRWYHHLLHIHPRKKMYTTQDAAL